MSVFNMVLIGIIVIDYTTSGGFDIISAVAGIILAVQFIASQNTEDDIDEETGYKTTSSTILNGAGVISIICAVIYIIIRSNQLT